jgi:hypothetical protein
MVADVHPKSPSPAELVEKALKWWNNISRGTRIAVTAASVLLPSTAFVFPPAKMLEAIRSLTDLPASVDTLRMQVSDLRKQVSDLTEEIAADKHDGDEKVVGTFSDVEGGWPKFDTTRGQISLSLYGITPANSKTEQDMEKKWIGTHSQTFTCRKASFADSKNNPRYRCLSGNTFDLSEALLLNGAATVLDDAPELYHKAQQQAKDARRGRWGHTGSTSSGG